ncbi:hypothetical protein AMTR_s00041p00220960 [Amborella trichopoda]|uniref:Non-haem dioxygenase N-terminal domain-containing protein n=1 Tax=Amborella trichopoda TaxID=13333 RepID=W1PZD4_AMBTC|nr:hypothetical protein AMTR_s00041p00220960 [Amborella trichopoda]
MSPTSQPFLPTILDEKTLRPTFIRPEDQCPKVAYNQFSPDIPVISHVGIESDSHATIREAVATACKDWGIFQVIDHGIDTSRIAKMTQLSKEFFALPPEEKLRFDMSGGKWGGFIVSSHLQGEAIQDWREIVTYFLYPVRLRDYSRCPDKPEEW